MGVDEIYRGKQGKFASLELSTEYNSPLAGISYKPATTPLPFEPNPRRVFERLFGEGGRIDPVAAAERDAADRSSLDTVTSPISDLKARLGPSDCRKLDEYLQSIRDVERRIRVAMEKRPVDLPDVSRPAGIPDSWPDHVKIMFDLQALALRVQSAHVGATDSRTYPGRVHFSGPPRVARNSDIGLKPCSRAADPLNLSHTESVS
jgi:hypothetical protein